MQTLNANLDAIIYIIYIHLLKTLKVTIKANPHILGQSIVLVRERLKAL